MADETVSVKILADVKNAVKGFTDIKSAFDMAYGASMKVVNAMKTVAKAASDAEEITSKYNTVFRDMGTRAGQVAKGLADNYGLADSTAKKLLSTTGDLLTGFGFSQSAALDLSEQVNSLAADLASFTNFEGGAEGAGMALTKAMLGETESAKSLGIVINQNNDRYKELIRYYVDVEGKTEQQAKAYTALTIATEQSKNAIGDYARTSDSSANVIKRYSEVQKELNEELGKLALEVGVPAINFLSKYAEALTTILQKQDAWFKILQGGIGGQSMDTLTAGLEAAKDQVVALEKAYKVRIQGERGATKEQIEAAKKRVADIQKEIDLINFQNETRTKINNSWAEYDRREAEAAKEKKTQLEEQLAAEQAAFDASLTASSEYWSARAEEEAVWKDALDERNKTDAATKQEELERAEKYFNDLSDYYEGYATHVTDTFAALGERMGESIVEQESMWDATGMIIRDAISGIIRALGSEAFVEAAKNMARAFAFLSIPGGQGYAGKAFAAAAKWTAVGTMANVAAGAVTAKFAQGGEFITSGPQSIMVGDNATGRERVKVEPLGNESGQSGMIHNVIVLDGRPIADFITRASKDGRIITSARSVR